MWAVGVIKMNSIAFQPLLAADILETVIGALFFILWIAAQLLGGRKEAQKKQPRPQQPVDLAEDVAPRRNQDLGNLGPRNQEEALRDEVEDFLRRATQGKPARVQEKSTRAQPPRERPVAPAARQVPGPPHDGGHALRDQGAAEHVARPIGTQEIATRTRPLGARSLGTQALGARSLGTRSLGTQALGTQVATADDRLELRLHEKFDHTVGRLEHRDIPEDDQHKKVDMAAEIAQMLRSPEGMRQLIVANEILRRPEW